MCCRRDEGNTDMGTVLLSDVSSGQKNRPHVFRHLYAYKMHNLLEKGMWLRYNENWSVYGPCKMLF